MLSKKTIRCFSLSMVFLAMATMAFLCIPLWSASTVPAYFVALIFWVSLVLQQVFFWKGNAYRKKMEKKVFRMKSFGKRSAGILNFGSNRMATIFDCAMLASMLVVALEMAVRVESQWLVMISLALLFLSFNLHCILNGTNYRYLIAYHKHMKRSVGKHE